MAFKQAPKGTFIPNASAQPTNDPETIRGLLAKQLMSPVHWTATMARAQESGLSLFLEVGPGKVLKGLGRKTLTGASIQCVGTVADFQKLDQLWTKVS